MRMVCDSWNKKSLPPADDRLSVITAHVWASQLATPSLGSHKGIYLQPTFHKLKYAAKVMLFSDICKL